MRLARVLGRAPDEDEPRCRPLLAIERDGALYDVAELERCFDTRYSPEGLAGAGDFHTRVFALACAGLDVLDDRLLAGDRPTEARLVAGSFVWLPPVDTDRALYVQIEDGADAPRYRLGSARALHGHDGAIVFPANEDHPGAEAGIAAVLGDDLHRATCDQAARSVIGYAIHVAWIAPALRSSSDALPATFSPQLGPILVTKDEVGDVVELRVELRHGEMRAEGPRMMSARFSVSESIAFASHHQELHGGDVIALAPSVRPEIVAYDVALEASAPRLGRLAGKPVRGSERVAWRRV